MFDGQRMPSASIEPLNWRGLAPLLLAMFAVSVGYGFLLPVLPSMIARVATNAGPADLSRHAGLLTAAYTLSLFLFAPAWGWIADRFGHRRILAIGLAGFALSLVAFVFADSLPLLYLGRFLDGAFSAAVTPAAYAIIANRAPSPTWRAHRFSLLSVAGSLGFLAGPMLGSLAVGVLMKFGPAIAATLSVRAPAFVTAGLALSALLASWLTIPSPAPGAVPAQQSPGDRAAACVQPVLLAIAFVTAAAIGLFEVELSLRAFQVLNLSTSQIGLMFSECSLVMLIVQTAIFSPLLRPGVTRWLIVPALIVLAAGLIAIAVAGSTTTTAFAVVLVAASAGILSPVATYWISLAAGESQGLALGRQTAAASLGQAIGSAIGGLFFSAGLAFGPSFWFVLVLILAAGGASLRLPWLLGPLSKSADTPASGSWFRAEEAR